MHDEVHENDRPERGGAQRHGPHTVRSERTVKSNAGCARGAHAEGTLASESATGGPPTWPAERVESSRLQLSVSLTPGYCNKSTTRRPFLALKSRYVPQVQARPIFPGQLSTRIVTMAAIGLPMRIGDCIEIGKGSVDAHRARTIGFRCRKHKGGRSCCCGWWRAVGPHAGRISVRGWAARADHAGTIWCTPGTRGGRGGGGWAGHPRARGARRCRRAHTRQRRCWSPSSAPLAAVARGRAGARAAATRRLRGRD